MKIAYATTFSAQDVHNWSGTPYYMSKALEESGCGVNFIGDLKRERPFGFKLKQIWHKWINGQRESSRFNIYAAQRYSEQAAKILMTQSSDIVLAPQMNPVAYLECKQPIVLWTDAVYASLVAFYPAFSNHSAQTIHQGNQITAACLARCHLAIFSSDWGARAAIELYGIQQEKVKVVPFGANMHCTHTQHDVSEWVKHRSQTTIKLLFLGKRWEQKGGPVVLKVTEALHQAGESVELTIVGCTPPDHQNLPAYVKCLGFISKRTPDGLARISRLLQESHFLFVPSQSEAYGIVFCEANAYGLPCLTTYVGGISTIVKNDINGKTFSLNASPREYCDYIVNIMANRERYRALALSAFHEYETRLNWETAVREVKSLMQDIL